MLSSVKSPVTRILVVDDHPVVRKGLAELFREEPDFEVCGEAGTVADALGAAQRARPDVAIVDITLGAESGLDLLARLGEMSPPVHVLVLSGHDERLYAERALRAGALGYVMKDQAADELVAAIRRVASGRSYVSPETADRILSSMGSSRRGSPDSRSPFERLTDREHHVLTLIGRGLTTKEIARQLDISVKTVETHFAHLKDKLGARNGKELARLAVSWTEQPRPPRPPQPPDPGHG